MDGILFTDCASIRAIGAYRIRTELHYNDYNVVIIYSRSFLGAGVPAVSPATNRITEALCIKLCSLLSSPRKKGGVIAFNVVVGAYMAISRAILGNAILTKRTSLVLPPTSVQLLPRWLV